MKKGSAIVLLLAISITSIAQKRDFEWAKNTFSDQGSSPTVVSSSMVVKPSGDMYLAGSNGKAGNGIAYGAPCFAKYDSDGAPIWVKYFEGSASAGATNSHRLREDSNGDMIALFYGSALDFDGTPTPISTQYVIVKFDTTGQVKWVNNFTGNQYDIEKFIITSDDDIALVISCQFVTAADTTIYGNNQPVLLSFDGADGSISLFDKPGYAPQQTASGTNFIDAWAASNNNLIVLRTEWHPFFEFYSLLTELSLDNNTIVSQDTITENFPTTSTGYYIDAAFTQIWDFNSDTKIAFVSGAVGMGGARLGADSIFGVNPSYTSTFLAKIDFSTGEILEKVVYYTPGVPEGVQLAMKRGNHFMAFIQYRDTIRNSATGDVYTGLDTIPQTETRPHCLIQSFDLDLNLKFYNQSATLAGATHCNSAGFDENDNLYMLYESGQNQYYDGFFLNTDGTVVLARIGDNTVGIESTDQIVSVDVYPNPTNSLIYIKSHESLRDVKVFDASGQLVLTPKRINNTMNLAPLVPGFYFISIETEAGTITKSIVKQ